MWAKKSSYASPPKTNYMDMERTTIHNILRHQENSRKSLTFYVDSLEHDRKIMKSKLEKERLLFRRQQAARIPTWNPRLSEGRRRMCCIPKLQLTSFVDKGCAGVGDARAGFSHRPHQAREEAFTSSRQCATDRSGADTDIHLKLPGNTPLCHTGRSVSCLSERAQGSDTSRRSSRATSITTNPNIHSTHTQPNFRLLPDDLQEEHFSEDAVPPGNVKTSQSVITLPIRASILDQPRMVYSTEASELLSSSRTLHLKKATKAPNTSGAFLSQATGTCDINSKLNPRDQEKISKDLNFRELLNSNAPKGVRFNPPPSLRANAIKIRRCPDDNPDNDLKKGQSIAAGCSIRP